MSLDDIVQNNQYPIVFIGSGMSLRYLNHFPNWQDLLENYWNQIFPDKNIFSFFRNITEKHPDLSTEEQDFLANTSAADTIEHEFNEQFFNGKLTVNGLSIKEAHIGRISPFKFDISQQFSTYEIRKGIEDEYALFQKFIQKAKVIVTTNYDSFIEDTICKDSNQQPNIFVGQEGLFDENIGWSEIYKIHGSVSKPNSIVINSKDYQEYDNHSILISAKILSSMINSPIIFLGYSLTDRNVRKLLSDFSTQLPKEDVRKSANRIFVIQYEKGNMEIQDEIVKDEHLNFDYTLISTDNYSDIYNKVIEINEGATPYEVRKYNTLIKKLIMASGKKGALDSVLVSPSQLDDISQQIDEGKPIVLAMGNAKYFYVYPDLLSYIKDYFEETDKYLPQVALSFVAHDGNKITKTPFSRYLHNVDLNSLQLKPKDIYKLNRKILNYPTLDELIEGISTYDKICCNSIEEIKSKKFKNHKLIQVLIFNIKKIDKKDLKEFIINDALSMFAQSVQDNSNLKSDLRKLFLAYDLLENGELKEIKKPVQNPQG